MSMWSVCLRKKRHTSKANAEKALAAQKAMQPPALPICELIVYKCPHCPGWHVGRAVAPAIVERSNR